MISRNRDPEPEHSEGPAVNPASAQPAQAVQRSRAEDTAEPEDAALDDDELLACVEAILFATGEPVPRRRLHRMLKGVPARRIDETLLRLEAELISTGRSFTLVEDAGGLRLMTRAEFAPYVARFRGEKRRVRLSQAAFETLAVIAYRQPMRRADLEAIRGVQCGAILKNLAEWDLIRVVGRDESLGRPLLYGTSKTFLEQFGLAGLADLPEPEDLRQLAGDHGVDGIEPAEEEMMYDPNAGQPATEAPPAPRAAPSAGESLGL